jgi:hypothetical protein
MLCVSFLVEVALFSLSQTEVDETTQGNPSKEKLYPSYWKRPKIIGDTSVANNFINIGVILFSL